MNSTQTTWAAIRALPAKGTDFARILAALGENAAKWSAAQGLIDYGVEVRAAAKGVRAMRDAAQDACNFAIDCACKRSVFIPPSEETLMWGGFLGGEYLSLKNEDAEAAELANVLRIIRENA